MATRRGPRTSVTKTNGFSACLSPPLWKDQLRERCLARLKQNRHQLLAKLRSPDANIADEMKRLVHSEQQREGRTARGHLLGRRRVGAGGSSARHPVFDLQRDGLEEEEEMGGSIEDLVVNGQLSEDDYLDIVHSLEDELRNEWGADGEDERIAQEMVEFEEASLAAMLAGMDLEGASDAYAEEQDPGIIEYVDSIVGGTDGVRVLCPICKAGSLRECVDDAVHAVISCSCGFSLRVKNILHGGLQDLHENISDAYLVHREECAADPVFAVFSDLDSEYEVTDSLLMSCSSCGHECLVR